MAKEMGDAKSFRMEIGYNILMEMERDQELPVANKYRLAKIMDEVFKREAYIDTIREAGYSWEPDVEYWMNHLADLSEYMRIQYKIYFAFVREDGEFSGIWKFTNKGEWERSLKREHQDISTRVENHNGKVDDTSLRWNVKIPKIAEVPRLIE